MTTTVAGYPDKFFAAFNSGLDYYRIYESISDTDTVWSFNQTGIIPVVPWGFFVGPDSGIDRFYYELNGIAYGFDIRSPLLDISVATLNAGTSQALQTFNSRPFPGGVTPTVDVFVFFRPAKNMLAPARANMILYSGTPIAYGAGNGVVTSGNSASNVMFGRRKLLLNGYATSAAVLRFDFYGQQCTQTGGTATAVPIMSYTTTGSANDGFGMSMDIPDYMGQFSWVLTKISGAAGTAVFEASTVD